MRNVVLVAGTFLLFGCATPNYDVDQTMGETAKTSKQVNLDDAPTNPVEAELGSIKNSFLQNLLQGQNLPTDLSQLRIEPDVNKEEFAFKIVPADIPEGAFIDPEAIVSALGPRPEPPLFADQAATQRVIDFDRAVLNARLDAAKKNQALQQAFATAPLPKQLGLAPHLIQVAGPLRKGEARLVLRERISPLSPEFQAFQASIKAVESETPSHPELNEVQNNQRKLPSNSSNSSTGNEASIIPFADPADGALLTPVIPNAYGPGLNSDATGRPFIWQPQGSTSPHPDPTLKVTPNAYGPGVGMDQYGRPVRPQTWP